MSFSTKGRQAEAMPEFSGSIYLNPGINLVTINKIEFVKSKAGDKEVATFYVEGKPVEGLDGGERPDKTKAMGLIGKATLGIYNPIGDEKAQDNLISSIAVIADACGVRDKIDGINVDTIEKFLDKATAYLNGKFFWCVINGNVGEKGWFLDSFRVYFVGKKGDPDRKTYIIAIPEKAVDIKSIKTEEEKGCIVSVNYEKSTGGTGVIKWDKNNKYDLRKSTISTVTPDEDLGGEVRQPDF